MGSCLSSSLTASAVRTPEGTFTLFHKRKEDERENDTASVLVICPFSLNVFILFGTNVGNLKLLLRSFHAILCSFEVFFFSASYSTVRIFRENK
jgi:hypothetical protein